MAHEPRSRPYSISKWESLIEAWGASLYANDKYGRYLNHTFNHFVKHALKHSVESLYYPIRLRVVWTGSVGVNVKQPIHFYNSWDVNFSLHFPWHSYCSKTLINSSATFFLSMLHNGIASGHCVAQLQY